MIHDAMVEVTCDNQGVKGFCKSSVMVELDFAHNDYSGDSGQYDHSDKKIERRLISSHEWIVKDGKHYCCQACAENAK